MTLVLGPHFKTYFLLICFAFFQETEYGNLRKVKFCHSNLKEVSKVIIPVLSLKNQRYGRYKKFVTDVTILSHTKTREFWKKCFWIQLNNKEYVFFKASGLAVATLYCLRTKLYRNKNALKLGTILGQFYCIIWLKWAKLMIEKLNFISDWIKLNPSR